MPDATTTLGDMSGVRRPLAAQLATVNPSGSPQRTIMWLRYEEGGFLFTTTTDRQMVR